MKMTPIYNSTMRHLILPLLAAGAVVGVADAASGVRIHRIGDPPLLPRYMDTKTSSQYKKRPATPEQLVKPVPAPPATAVADPSARSKSLPLAPEGYTPSRVTQQSATPAVRGRRLPLAPAPVAAPPAPAPKPVVVPTPAPEPKPIAPPAPTKKPTLAPPPAPKPAVVPTAPAPAAPAAKPRRRLPIAPIVADGSTDLPPVPEALIGR